VQLLLLDPRTAVNQARMDDGTTPLYIAACNDRTDCVQLLLADPRTAVNQARTDDGTTPLYTAAGNGHTDCVQLLLKDPRTAVNQVSFNGDSPLIAAAHEGHSETIDLLLLDDLPSLIDFFPTWRGLVMTNLLCNTGGHSPPRLPVLVWKFIFSFLRPRTHVNQAVHVTEGLSGEGAGWGLVPGATALWLAAARGHTAIVERLLARMDVCIDQPDAAAGRTPRMIAEENGQAECVALLVEKEKSSRKAMGGRKR
jgi:ankyrin repeat protein